MQLNPAAGRARKMSISELTHYSYTHMCVRVDRLLPALHLPKGQSCYFLQHNHNCPWSGRVGICNRKTFGDTFLCRVNWIDSYRTFGSSQPSGIIVAVRLARSLPSRGTSHSGSYPCQGMPRLDVNALRLLPRHASAGASKSRNRLQTVSAFARFIPLLRPPGPQRHALPSTG